MPNIKEFTIQEIHNNELDCLVVINKNVYNLTKFKKYHPGGEIVIDMVAGTNCSDKFNAFHNKLIQNLIIPFKIGKLIE